MDVTFVENVFPFRRFQHQSTPASLLWGAERTTPEGDARLGMFEDVSMNKVLDSQPCAQLELCEDVELQPPTISQSGQVKRSGRLQAGAEAKSGDRLWWPSNKNVSSAHSQW